MQVPTDTRTIADPDIEQAVDITGTVVKLTGSVLLAVAVRGTFAPPNVCADGPVKLMLCAVPRTVSVKLWVAAGGIPLFAPNVTT